MCSVAIQDGGKAGFQVQVLAVSSATAYGSPEVPATTTLS